MVDAKKNVKEIVKKFKCGKTQIYEIIRNKDRIMDQYKSGNSNDLKKQTNHIMKYPKINEITFAWFTAARAKNLPISGPILQQKARDIAIFLGNTEFTASNGWLQSFRNRYDIRFHVVSGESNDVDSKIVENWRNNLPVSIENYEMKNIANADETSLFFRALPVKSLQLKGERCSGGKKAKERLTVLLTVFADGKIEKPMVIGKSSKPRCFKNLNLNKLPVEWRANRKAWMTTCLFEEYLINLNVKMRNQSRHILLFIDNATCHPEMNLSNVKIKFLPKNTTAVLQPLDNGIIQNFKLNYRSLFMKQLISKMDTCESLSSLVKKINVLDAISLIGSSVAKIKAGCVKKCFINCGFPFSQSSEDIQNPEENEILELKNMITETQIWSEPVDISEFINVDECVYTELDDICIQNLIEAHDSRADSTKDDNASDYSEYETSQEIAPTSVEIQKYIRSIKTLAVNEGDNEFYNKVIDMEIAYHNMKKNTRKLVQSTLDSFVKFK